MATRIFIGVGSNVGDRASNIDLAKALLEQAGIVVLKASPVYETSALSRIESKLPDFLNVVLEVQTELEPLDLLGKLESIEQMMGRTSKGDWAPRMIDLDLLLYGDRIIDTERLKLPHPEMAKRWFVLKPLADVAPDVVHPVLGKTVNQLFRDLS